MSTQQTGQVRNVSEREARQVAEEAREAGWQKPSFGKQLYLGDFQLDLIHPHPRPDEEAVRRGEEFCARMREFCETSVDGALIERDARIPDEVVKGLAALGAFGMKIAPEYGGLGLTNLYYNRALIIAGSVSPASRRCCRRTSRSACRSRWRCSGPTTRSSATCRGARAARSARSCSPSPTSARTRPG